MQKSLLEQKIFKWNAFCAYTLKTGRFLFIFFALNTLNRKVTLAVSPLLLF